MKKLYLILITLGISIAASAQEMLPRLSPGTKSYLNKISRLPQGNLLPEGVQYKKRNDGKVCVSAVIQINKPDAPKVQASLSSLNASVGTKAGIIWTVQVPLEQVVPFTKIQGIRYIQLDEPVVVPQLDSARAKTNVDSAHAGYGLPQGYSGKGVLVGILDFGFDYNHPTMYDTAGKKYRIVKAWEMNATGTPPAGYSYGHEITDTTALKARGTDNPDQIHGAGVAGLAVGSGFGSTDGKLYRGVAYESDVIVVGVRRDSIGEQWKTGGFSDFIDGVSYMMDYADKVGKPIVINISWGSHSGPHDGSSLVNQAFDAMTGNGKIIVMSAGNEGRNNLHLGKSFTATDTVVTTFVTFTSPFYKRTWIDVWGDTAETFCIKTSLYSKGLEGNTTGKICLDNGVHYDTLIAANGLDTCYVETITSDAEYNLKPRATVSIYSKATDSIGLTITGTKGDIDMWNEYYYYGYKYGFSSDFSAIGIPWATSGNTNTTVSDMGAGLHTLLVGAYTSRTSFNDLTGTKRTFSGYSENALCSFSSRGPYVDGRIKPDITAPGMVIMSSMNSMNTAYSDTGSQRIYMTTKYTDPSSGKDYYYGTFSGTSAASPMAAGIVALMLQCDPSLNPERIKSILFATAIKDFYTGPIPTEGNNNWGHGKINAYQAIRKLLTELSVITYAGNKKLDCVLFPNPGEGLFTLDYLAQHNDNLIVSISDMSGRILNKQDWKVSGGQNMLALNLSSYSKGIYFVKVDSKEGSASIKTVLQ